MEVKKLDNLSFQEYLDLEIEAQQRYEYHDGRIFAMAVGSINHSLIGGNIFLAIGKALEEKNSNCFAINNDLKLHILASNKFVYPDGMIVCGENRAIPSKRSCDCESWIYC